MCKSIASASQIRVVSYFVPWLFCSGPSAPTHNKTISTTLSILTSLTWEKILGPLPLNRTEGDGKLAGAVVFSILSNMLISMFLRNDSVWLVRLPQDPLWFISSCQCFVLNEHKQESLVHIYWRGDPDRINAIHYNINPLYPWYNYSRHQYRYSYSRHGHLKAISVLYLAVAKYLLRATGSRMKRI